MQHKEEQTATLLHLGMSRSTMTVGSRLANRELYAIATIGRPASQSVTVRFRVETKRSARGDGESQAYDFNLSREDALALRDRLTATLNLIGAN
jgi:hypothetical protein